MTFKDQKHLIIKKSINVEIVSGEEHCNEEEIGGDEITLEGKQGKFKEVETIHHKYSQRPESLKEVCLAQFATSYVYTQLDRIPKETEWEDNSSVKPGQLKQFISQKCMPKYIRYSNLVAYLSYGAIKMHVSNHVR